MARFIVCLILLFCMFGAIASLKISFTNCHEVGRVRGKEETGCGFGTAIVKERCCWKILRFLCYSRTRTIRTCNSFSCQNGGTQRIPRGKHDANNESLSECTVRPHTCTCPQGFSGICCEIPIDPCKYTKCGFGQVCKTQPRVCKKAPCPPKAICVPRNKPGSCPRYLEFGKLPCRRQCGSDADCNGAQKCCSRYCSRVCVNPKPKDPCALIDCEPDKTCKAVVLPCLIPPCPVIPRCVSKVTNPCAATLCLADHTCVVENGQARCKPPVVKGKPGSCPIYAEFAQLPCINHCKGDFDCNGQQKCCERHCSRVCVNPRIADKPSVPSGICPLFPNTITTCQVKHNSCGKDSQCPIGEKCCRRGCGSECVKALPKGTSGCARVVCRPGTTCQEQSYSCLFRYLFCKKRAVCTASDVSDEETTSPPFSIVATSPLPPSENATTMPPEDNTTTSPFEDPTTLPPQDNTTTSPFEDPTTLPPEDDTTTSPFEDPTTLPPEDDTTTSTFEDPTTLPPEDDTTTSPPSFDDTTSFPTSADDSGVRIAREVRSN